MNVTKRQGKNLARAHKWICAVATVAVIAGFTVPVSAQTLIQCSGSANNPLIRAEDYTALAGDIFVTCTGGVPVAPGALIPKVTITVFVTNTAITSKITDATLTPAFNEALLIVDEAGTTNSANSILNCGSATAPYGNVPFTCDTLSPNGDGTGDYDGKTNHPNVFQGRQVDNSFGQAIQFIGVPIDPPGPATTPFSIPTRTLRITNLRVNAAALNVYVGNPFSLTTINTTVSFNGTIFGGNQIVNVQNGTIRPGLMVTGQLSASPQNFLQCSASPSVVSLNNITLSEGYPTAFRVRNWRQIQDNGVPHVSPGAGWTWSGGSLISPIDLNQNVPNALYNTETGINFDPALAVPSPNPPDGTGSNGVAPTGTAFNGSTGIASVGEAAQGTRFAIKFSTIPVGSNPSVPLAVVLTAGTTGIPTGVMELVCGTDDTGAGGVPGSCIAATGPGYSGNTMLIPANGLVVYEVAFSNPNALETASINVSVNPTVNLSANPPFGGSPQVNMTAQAVAGFAPFYAASTGAGVAQLMSPQLIAASPASVPPIPASAPIPRFRDDLTGQAPISLFSFVPCPALTGSITAKSGPANARDWKITVYPIAPRTANDNAQITGLTLKQSFGAACTPVIATVFPVNIGNLLPFPGTGHLIIDFSGCSATARFTAVLSFSTNSGAITGSTTFFNQYR